MSVALQIPYGYDETLQGFYWPSSAQKRIEILSVKRNAPADFEAIYQGRPGQREGSIFLSADLNNFYVPPIGLELGIANDNVRAFCSHGHLIAQAWDTAFSTSYQAAHTVCATGLFIPCNRYHCGEDPNLVGPCDFHFDVALLNIYREKIDWGALVDAFKRQFALWTPDVVVIEKKASGISLIQSLSAQYPIIAAPSSTGKRERAINSVNLKTAGSVQGWFRQHRVLVPKDAPWFDKWRTEMKDFSGNDDASSDQVDATVHLISHAITTGATAAVLPTGWTPEQSSVPARASEIARQQFDAPIDPRAQLLSMISILPELSEDPYYGTCARCVNKDASDFCRVQLRRVVAMDSCPSFSDQHERQFESII